MMSIPPILGMYYAILIFVGLKMDRRVWRSELLTGIGSIYT